MTVHAAHPAPSRHLAPSPIGEPRRAMPLAVSVGVSVVVHAVLLGVLALVVVRVVVPKAGELKPADREVFLSLATSNPEAWSSAVPWDSPARPAEVEPEPVTGGPTVVVPGMDKDFDPTASLANRSDAAARANVSMSLKNAGATVTFGGLSQGGRQAASVVYVVDASGPMVSSLPQVFAELQRSVDSLTPTQKFAVVLFRDNGQSKFDEFQPELRDASARYRAELGTWLRQHQSGAVGKSNPLDGLRQALTLKPQVVFLLSRSIPRSQGGQWDKGLVATLAELDTLNPVNPETGQRRTVIKTIQFLEPDSTGIMRQIADAHGSGNLATDHRVLSLREVSAAAPAASQPVNLPEQPKRKQPGK
ncbi:MAG: hypothetical protein ACREJO_06880 [Phycisphaerales bacterium]